MASSFKISDLAAELQRNIADVTTIFGLKMVNGFDLKKDGTFTVLPCKDKVPLVRDEISAILQPGRTGSTNYTNDVVALKSRTGVKTPFKFDLKLDEVTLYAWSNAYLANKKPTDPTDIYSFEAMSYYMGRIFAGVGRDISSALYAGVYNASGGVGNTFMDGLGVKFTKGALAVGSGGDGDIPAGNVVTAATTITSANILAELDKIATAIIANASLEPYIETAASLYIPLSHKMMIISALEALPTLRDSTVIRDANGIFRLSKLPNTTIESKPMLSGTQKQFWTPTGNLFFLAPEAGGDISSLTIEKADRTLKILGDSEAGVDYADGRLIVMNNK